MSPQTTPLDVDARGIRVRFHETGEGKAILLLHDFLANRNSWGSIVSALGMQHRVLALDLPGFGESEHPNPARFRYDFATFADAILDTTAALGLSRVTLIGHGLGASIALALAAKHPSVVENLIIESPFVFECNHGRWVSLASVPVLGRLLFKQAFGEAVFRQLLGSPKATAEVSAKRYAQFDTPAARESAHATLVGMTDTRPLVAVLPRISTRTLIVWGRHDERCPAIHARVLSRQIVNSRLEVIDAGHFAHEERPTEFQEIVLDFLHPRKKQSASVRSRA